jgi:hypothetical protein
MDHLTKLFAKDHRSELILLILMILYLFIGIKPHEKIAMMVDSLVGRLTIVLVVIYLFMRSNPIVAIIAALVAFDLLRKSAHLTGYDALHAYAPSEEKKISQFSAFNQFPYTLEQEVVGKMAPLVYSGTPLDSANYKPTLDNLHNASSLHDL